MIPLIITIIIDVMGSNIILPLLPALLMQPHIGLLPNIMNDTTRYIFYGVCVALWPLGIFIGTPYLSGLSDSYGRKKILILALLGTAITLLLSAVSVLLSSFILFAFCRFLSGVFSGTFSVAQASATHMSQSYKEKMRRLGWLSFAGTVGAIIGPILSGFLVGYHPTLWQLSLPFFVAAGLAFLNIGLLYINFHEPEPTGIIEKRFNFKRFFNGIYINIIFIFVDKRLRLYMILFCLIQIGWGAYIQGLPLLLSEKFHLHTPGISKVFMCLALALGIAQATLRSIVTKYLQPLQIFMISSVILAIFAFLLTTTSTLLMAYLYAGTSVIFEMLAYTGIISLFSDAVNPNEQGKVIGGTGAIFGLAWMISGIFTGQLAALSVLLPIFLCGGFTLAAGLLPILWRSSKQGLQNVIK